MKYQMNNDKSQDWPRTSADPTFIQTFDVVKIGIMLLTKVDLVYLEKFSDCFDKNPKDIYPCFQTNAEHSNQVFKIVQGLNTEDVPPTNL